jgi:microcystin-dependent protein
MSNPYVGEIRLFGGNFAPAGWAFCNGALLAISENDVLFTLIGTTYGGDGQTTFALPDLQGRVPVHVGGGLVQGEQGGVETVTLNTNTIPVHSHPMLGSTDLGTASTVQNNVPASLTPAGTASAYGQLPPFGALDPSSIGVAGGSQPHENMQPYLALNYILSLFGRFPNQ